MAPVNAADEPAIEEQADAPEGADAAAAIDADAADEGTTAVTEAADADRA